MIIALVVLAQIATASQAPAPAPKLGGGFGQKATATAKVQKARVVITDAASAPVRRGTFSVAGVAATPSPAPGAPPAELVDEEAAWKDRVAQLRAERAAAQKEYDAASAANTVITWGDPNSWEYQQLVAARNAALTPYSVRLSEIQREIDGLPDECRKTAGCQPGWVR